MTSPTDLLFGGGAPGAKFKHPGDTYQGRILQVAVKQATKYGTTELDVWPSGDPKMQLEIDVQTTLRDPEFDNDTGVRRIYIDSKRKKEALRDAVLRAGVREPEVGGHLSMTYTGDGVAERGNQPPKLYDVEYTKPAPVGATSQAILGTGIPSTEAFGVGTATVAPAAIAALAEPLPAGAGQLNLEGQTPEVQAVMAQLLAKQQATKQAAAEPPF